MTEKTGTETEVRTDTTKRATSKKWTGLANGDTGAPLAWPPGSDKTVQVRGTFGTGGHCKIEGSLDGTNYYVLTDPTGNALDFTSAGIKAITEHCPWIRPNITAGDGTTDLEVIIFASRMRSP